MFSSSRLGTISRMVAFITTMFGLVHCGSHTERNQLRSSGTDEQIFSVQLEGNSEDGSAAELLGTDISALVSVSDFYLICELPAGQYIGFKNSLTATYSSGGPFGSCRVAILNFVYSGINFSNATLSTTATPTNAQLMTAFVAFRPDVNVSYTSNSVNNPQISVRVVKQPAALLGAASPPPADLQAQFAMDGIAVISGLNDSRLPSVSTQSMNMSLNILKNGNPLQLQLSSIAPIISVDKTSDNLASRISGMSIRINNISNSNVAAMAYAICIYGEPSISTVSVNSMANVANKITDSSTQCSGISSISAGQNVPALLAFANFASTVAPANRTRLQVLTSEVPRRYTVWIHKLQSTSSPVGAIDMGSDVAIGSFTVTQ